MFGIEYRQGGGAARAVFAYERCAIVNFVQQSKPRRAPHFFNREKHEHLFVQFNMALIERIQKDLTAAMMSKDELRLSVLRMIKSALKYKEVEKVRPLEDAEALQVLQTLVKQRRESVEQFAKVAARIWRTRKPRKLRSWKLICRLELPKKT